MCGLNFTINDPLSSNNIYKMNDCIKHRGFGDHAHALNIDGLSFGHVRLPIQGLSKDYDQPFHYKNWLILFNGEIFNYKKLNPAAKSDIEVLAQYWDTYGFDAFSYFDGFWSVIIYKIDSKELYAITDYLAKKPLYMNEFGSVSSEIKALCVGVRPNINHLYFAQVAKWGYAANNQTFDNGIIKIPPASYVYMNLQSPETVLSGLSKTDILQYDHYSVVPRRHNNLIEIMKQAIKNRLVSDIPVSILLSGGMDSSIIYTLAKRYTNNITLFHIDNNEEEFLNYLNIPSDTTIKKIHLSNCISKSLIDDILYYNESPVDLGSMIQQYLLSQAIKANNISVTLSGDGADELFGGYTRMNQYDAQYSDIHDELIYYHLPKLDKLMMAHTVELRCPFLSREIIQHALSLPYKDRINKSYLKEIFKYVIPDEIIERKKTPLKINHIINDPMEWRLYLIERFKEIMMQYYL